MEKRTIGDTGITVAPLAFGGNVFGREGFPHRGTARGRHCLAPCFTQSVMRWISSDGRGGFL